MTRRTILLAAAAVLGIVATAMVAWAASQLAAPGVGLSDEPSSVVSGLAPVSTSPSAHSPGRTAPRVRHKPRRLSPGPTPPPASGRSSTVPAPVTPTTIAPPAPAPSPTPAPATPPTASPPAATATTTPKAPQPKPRQHRDDSSGGGSGDSRSGRDD